MNPFSTKVPGLRLVWSPHSLQMYMDDPWSYSLSSVHGWKGETSLYLTAGTLYGQARQALDAIDLFVNTGESLLHRFVRQIHEARFPVVGAPRVHPDRLLAALIAVIDDYWPKEVWEPLPESREHEWRMVLPIKTRDGEPYVYRGRIDGRCKHREDGTTAIREYKWTSTGLYLDKYLASLQVQSYLWASAACYGDPVPALVLDLLSVVGEQIKAPAGHYKTGARKGQPKFKNLGWVPSVTHEPTLITASPSQVTELEHMVCYWIKRAEDDAYQGRFVDRYGAGCPWNPSGQSRYDSEENMSTWRMLKAQPPETRISAIEMMLDQVEDEHCMPKELAK